MADAVGKIKPEVLKRFVPFQGLSEASLNDVLSKGRLERYSLNKIVFKRGDRAKKVFFLLTGSIDLADADFTVRKVTANSSDAEHALDSHQSYINTAISTDVSICLVLDREYLERVLTWSQSQTGSMVSVKIDRSSQLLEDDEDEDDWMSALLQSSIFERIPPANIASLFTKFEEIKVLKGQHVIKQGEAGDYFYTLKHGKAIVRVVIVKGDRRETKLLAELDAGACFGEDALIGNTTRNATITMVSDGALMRLGHDDFQQLLKEPVLDYMTEAELADLLSKDPGSIQVLDVRLPKEYERSHREGAINVPLMALRPTLQQLDPELAYATVCDQGKRSEMGAYILTEAGFTAKVLKSES